MDEHRACEESDDGRSSDKLQLPVNPDDNATVTVFQDCPAAASKMSVNVDSGGEEAAPTDTSPDHIKCEGGRAFCDASVVQSAILQAASSPIEQACVPSPAAADFGPSSRISVGVATEFAFDVEPRKLLIGLDLEGGDTVNLVRDVAASDYVWKVLGETYKMDQNPLITDANYSLPESLPTASLSQIYSATPTLPSATTAGAALGNVSDDFIPSAAESKTNDDEDGGIFLPNCTIYAATQSLEAGIFSPISFGTKSASTAVIEHKTTAADNENACSQGDGFGEMHHGGANASDSVEDSSCKSIDQAIAEVELALAALKQKQTQTAAGSNAEACALSPVHATVANDEAHDEVASRGVMEADLGSINARLPSSSRAWKTLLCKMAATPKKKVEEDQREQDSESAVEMQEQQVSENEVQITKTKLATTKESRDRSASSIRSRRKCVQLSDGSGSGEQNRNSSETNRSRATTSRKKSVVAFRSKCLGGLQRDAVVAGGLGDAAGTGIPRYDNKFLLQVTPDNSPVLHAAQPILYGFGNYDNKVRMCCVCGARHSFANTQMMNFRRHYNDFHGGPHMFRCTTCNVLLNSGEEVRNHTLNKNKKLRKKAADGSPCNVTCICCATDFICAAAKHDHGGQHDVLHRNLLDVTLTICAQLEMDRGEFCMVPNCMQNFEIVPGEHYQEKHGMQQPAPFACTTCNVEITTAEDGKQHLADKNDSCEMQCNVCSESRLNFASFVFHVEGRSHTEKTGVCVIPDCQQKFSTTPGQHYGDAHNLWQLPEYVCTVCKRNLDNFGTAVTHALANNDACVFDCCVCGLKSLNFRELGDHHRGLDHDENLLRTFFIRLYDNELRQYVIERTGKKPKAAAASGVGRKKEIVVESASKEIIPSRSNPHAKNSALPAEKAKPSARKRQHSSSDDSLYKQRTEKKQGRSAATSARQQPASGTGRTRSSTRDANKMQPATVSKTVVEVAVGKRSSSNAKAPVQPKPVIQSSVAIRKPRKIPDKVELVADTGRARTWSVVVHATREQAGGQELPVQLAFVQQAIEYLFHFFRDKKFPECRVCYKRMPKTYDEAMQHYLLHQRLAVFEQGGSQIFSFDGVEEDNQNDEALCLICKRHVSNMVQHSAEAPHVALLQVFIAETINNANPSVPYICFLPLCGTPMVHGLKMEHWKIQHKCFVYDCKVHQELFCDSASTQLHTQQYDNNFCDIFCKVCDKTVLPNEQIQHDVTIIHQDYLQQTRMQLLRCLALPLLHAAYKVGLTKADISYMREGLKISVASFQGNDAMQQRYGSTVTKSSADVLQTLPLAESSTAKQSLGTTTAAVVTAAVLEVRQQSLQVHDGAKQRYGSTVTQPLANVSHTLALPDSTISKGSSGGTTAALVSAAVLDVPQQSLATCGYSNESSATASFFDEFEIHQDLRHKYSCWLQQANANAKILLVLDIVRTKSTSEATCGSCTFEQLRSLTFSPDWLMTYLQRRVRPCCFASCRVSTSTATLNPLEDIVTQLPCCEEIIHVKCLCYLLQHSSRCPAPDCDKPYYLRDAAQKTFFRTAAQLYDYEASLPTFVFERCSPKGYDMEAACSSGAMQCYSPRMNFVQLLADVNSASTVVAARLRSNIHYGKKDYEEFIVDIVPSSPTTKKNTSSVMQTKKLELRANDFDTPQQFLHCIRNFCGFCINPTCGKPVVRYGKLSGMEVARKDFVGFAMKCGAAVHTACLCAVAYFFDTCPGCWKAKIYDHFIGCSVAVVQEADSRYMNLAISLPALQAFAKQVSESKDEGEQTAKLLCIVQLAKEAIAAVKAEDNQYGMLRSIRRAVQDAVEAEAPQ